MVLATAVSSNVITDLLQADHIWFLNEETRDDALKKMSQNLSDISHIDNPDQVFEAIMHRENIVSTGIGMGVALPHAKHESYSEFFVGLGIQPEKGIDWDSIDGMPVRLIFMIAGPSDQQSDYLTILSHITHLVRDEELRKLLINAHCSQEVINVFQTYPSI